MSLITKILVTGSAGFIGFHLVNELVQQGYEVVGLDNLNNYYDVKLKLDRLAKAGIKGEKIAYNEPVKSTKYPNYTFLQLSIENSANLERLFHKEQFEIVCHLAAQAGVRYSVKNPEAYIQSNIIGFFNILEACRHHTIQHLVFASSSSVYGLNEKMPFSTSDNVDHPVSLYAASKKSNELMAHTYSHLYNIPMTGLRFFTVYGPWGRPDMAYMLFAKAILEHRPIKVFNHGKMKRDFTYIDDVVEGLTRVIQSSPLPDSTWSGEMPNPATSKAPYRIYNMGNNQPVKLMDFIEAIEIALNQKAQKIMLPLQQGDVEMTYADVSSLLKDFNYSPKTSVKEGIDKFIAWYQSYFQVPL